MPAHFELLFSRRNFLTVLSSGAISLCFQRCQTVSPKAEGTQENQSDFLIHHGPIDRTIGELHPKEYSGDSFGRPHQILWDIPGYLASHPIPSSVEEHPLVIVGAGGSGLFSAYNLKEFRPVLLEQAARFGGNAKGQSWRGLDYALGSAYIDLPELGTPMRRYYDELGWREILTERNFPDPVEWNGKLYRNFWEGETEAKTKIKYLKLHKFFKTLCEEKDGVVFPDIPAYTPEEKRSVRTYDRMDLHTLLSKKAGGKLSPILETAIEHFCWSTYAGSSKELSAAAALNFLARESATICASAGGNAALLERLLQRLLQQIPSSNFRTRCLVLKVSVESDGAKILYEDGEGALRAIHAKCAVLCCPKFVVSKILSGIEPERIQAISKLRYRAYMVANLLLNTEITEKLYDVFLTGKGSTNLSDVETTSEQQNATDFVLANFAGKGKDLSVLTFYRAFPYDGGRGALFQPTSFETYKMRFEAQIEKQILPLLRIDSKHVVDLRLTRWGHALPLAAQGLYQGGVVDQLRKPFRDRVFFVEQDNWSYPALQTGAAEATFWTKEIKRVLGLQGSV